MNAINCKLHPDFRIKLIYILESMKYRKRMKQTIFFQSHIKATNLVLLRLARYMNYICIVIYSINNLYIYLTTMRLALSKPKESIPKIAIRLPNV